MAAPWEQNDPIVDAPVSFGQDDPVVQSAPWEQDDPIASTPAATLPVGGAITKGFMRLGGALVDLPKHIVGQLKLPKMSGMARAVLDAKTPELRAIALKNMAEVEGFFDRATKELGRAGELHRIGTASIIKNHPEWESEPPESFVDLVTSPDKLVVSLAESLPVLLSAGIMAAGGAPQVGVMMMYASEGQEAYDRAKADDAIEEEAESAYVVYGTVSAALESMQLKGIMKIGKGMWNAVLTRTAQKVARRGAKALIMEVIKVAAKEGLEEMSQGTWGDVTAKMVYGEPFASIGEFIDRRAQEFYIGAAMGVTAGGGGAAAAKITQKLKSNFETGKAGVTDVVEEVQPVAEDKIKAAAYFNPDTGKIGEGITHAQAAANLEGGITVPEGGRPVQEGFVTESGKFVSNEEAAEIAKKTKQLPENYELTQEERILGRPTAQNILAQKPPTPDEAIGKQYGLKPAETNERLGQAELKYRELKNKPVKERTKADNDELAFLSRNRKNIQSLLDRETTPMEPKKMTRRKALALGHIIPKELGWTEEQRREFNKKITNNRSMKDMTPAQREQVITALKKEAQKAGIDTADIPDSNPAGELAAKLRERKQKPALTRRDRRNMTKLRKALYTMKSGTSFYFLHSSRLKRLCNALDNYEDDGPFTRYIYQPVKDADTKANVEFTRAMGAAVATMNDLGIDASSMMTEVKDIGIEDKLSTAERIGVWALAQNEQTMKHLTSEFSEQEIAKIVESVKATENEMLVAANVQTYFESQWPQFQATAEANGITGMTKVENYMTAFVTDKNDLGQGDFLEGLMQQFTEGKFVPGEQHTIERKKGAKRNLELNIFVIHARAARALERFTVMAPVASEVGSILGNRQFKQALNDVTYGHGSRMLDRWLQDSVRGSAAYDSSALARAARWMRMSSIHYVLGFKILTAGKQGLSLFPAMGVDPGMIPLVLANLERASAGLKYKQMEKDAFSKSDLLRTRDWNRDLRQVYNQKAIKKMYAGQKLSPMSMRMASWMDRHTTTIAWTSAYQLAQKQDTSEDESIRFADGVIEKTQPMGKAVDLPAYFRGGELQKNLTTFQNQVNQNGNIMWYDILGETKARKIGLPMAGYRLLMSQVLPAILLGMISRGRPPRNIEEIAKDLLFYAVSPFLFVGKWVYTAATGEWAPGRMIAETPFKKAFVDLPRAVRAAAKDEATPEEIQRVVVEGAHAAAAFSGGKVPAAAIQTAEAGWDLATGEDTDFRRLVWSKYALRKGAKKEKDEFTP